MLSLLRTELEKLFQSLSADRLDRMAYEIWKKKNDEYDEWCKQAGKDPNRLDKCILQKPMLSRLRSEIGNALKSLSVEELDRMAYEMWKKKNDEYEEYLQQLRQKEMFFRT